MDGPIYIRNTMKLIICGAICKAKDCFVKMLNVSFIIKEIADDHVFVLFRPLIYNDH